MLINECDRIGAKVGYSALENSQPKEGHAWVATKDFIFITGGKHNREENNFEIFILKNNSIFKGPDMMESRSSHCSFIIHDYIYVMFGTVLESYGSSMSFEKIKVPTHGLKISLKKFYEGKSWKKNSLNFFSNTMCSFNSYSWFKTLDSRIICFGRYGKHSSIHPSWPINQYRTLWVQGKRCNHGGGLQHRRRHVHNHWEGSRPRQW